MSREIISRVKVVLFDFDDTLVATIEAKWAEHKHVSRKYYGKELPDELIKKHWGVPLSELVSKLYDTDDVDLALERIEKEQHKFPKLLHDDTMATIEYLKGLGKKVGVVTATQRFSFDYDNGNLNIPDSTFDYVQTEEDTSYHKPDPRVFDPVLDWIKKLKIDPTEVVYIGDSLKDMEAALGAGFEFIGVETGLVTQDKFVESGAKNTIERLGDLTRK